MNNSRYILEPYKGKASRYTCPNCHKPHEFTRYIDSRTGEQLNENTGKCNRVDKCGYHYTPKQYFAENGIKPKNIRLSNSGIQSPKPRSYIDREIFNSSLKGYTENNLIKYLHTHFDINTVSNLIYLYKIGTSKRYNGGTTVFWQIDVHDRIRTGKLIKYDKHGHRIKGLNNWVHSVLKTDNFNLEQCFFGEHILKHALGYSIAIVESEKTAIIMQAKVPELLWLASGGAGGINSDKVKVLKGRNVILFPDASKDSKIFNTWKQKANQFGFEISDYLEQYANDEQKLKGVDIADFL